MPKQLEKKALIALLEDDPDVTDIIRRTLNEFGFTTTTFLNATEFLREVGNAVPVLCIIDLNLPDADGLDVVDVIRREMSCGILILTSRISLAERVIGLERGADDYLLKPFDPRELVARVRSVLRRCQNEAGKKVRQTARFGDWTFNLWTNTLESSAGESHVLSVLEAETLYQFLNNPKRIISREKLSPYPDVGHLDRSIDVRISRLRSKLERDPHHPELIRTLYGEGYIFSADVTWMSDPD